jgi:hypothetical protein
MQASGHAVRDDEITVSSSMNMIHSEDLSTERLNWIIGHIDEMFSELDDIENET